MSSNPRSTGNELRTWTRQLEQFKAAEDERRKQDEEKNKFAELLLQRVSELESSLHLARADLEDEKDTRRRWRKRAEEAESRSANNQFAVALIDGNHFIFQQEYMQSGLAGACEAVRIFLAEGKEFVHSRHVGDIPELMAMNIFIFADAQRLAKALREAGTIQNEYELVQFTRDLSQADPFVAFVDCGAGRNAVDAKIKEFYQLYVENCHCRHLLLALDRDSDYLSILHSYAEDEFTLSKTSLVKSSHGYPQKYNLPFSVVEFSCLSSIPLISFGDTNEGSIKNEDIQQYNSDLADLTNTENGTHSESPMEPSGEQAEFRETNINGEAEVASERNAVTILESAKSMPSDEVSNTSMNQDVDGSRPLQKQNSEQSSTSQEPKSATRSTGPPSSSSQTSNSVSLRFGDEKSPQKSLNISPVGRLPSSDWGAAPENSPWHFEGVEYNPSAMQDWERAPPSNLYNKPADDTPWGDAEAPKPPATPFKQDEGDAWIPSQENETSRRDGWASTKRPIRSRRVERRILQRPPAPDRDKQVWTGVHSPTQGLSASAFAPEQAKTPGRTIRSPIAINQHGQRIDQALPLPASHAQNELELRIQTRKLCNEHHIRGRCHDTRCGFDHTPVEPDIVLALRHLARRSPCSIGPQCRRPDCFHGHHCPYKNCHNRKCGFRTRGMHDVDDLTVVREITPDL